MTKKQTVLGDALEEQIANEFALVQGSVKYLNNAATGPLPKRSITAMKDWAAMRAEPWKVTDREVVFPTLTRTRNACAKLIGAKPTEIGLTPSTSFGLNIAARCLPLKRGDVVLASDGEFPSVIYAWRSIEQRRGIELKLLPMSNELPDDEALLQALDSPNVKAVAVSWVSFSTGYKFDLERLGRECRSRGIYLIVDAMQGLGPAVLDAHACGADIIACGGYKWLLSPWGTGFVYVREELIERLDPPIVGWFIGPSSEDFTRLLDYDLTYFSDARRFELMSLPAQDFAAMAESLELILETGPVAIEEHVSQLCDRIVDWASGNRSVRLITPADRSKRAGIVSVATTDVQTTSEKLREQGIIHSLREGGIRLSPYFYNTTDHIDRAIDILERSS